MSETPPDWAISVPSVDLHNLPVAPNQLQPPDLSQLGKVLAQLIENGLKQVVLALVGSIFPDTPAFGQLQDWGQHLDIAAGVQALKDLLTGRVNATPNDVDNWLLGLLTGESPINPAKLGENLWPLGLFPAGSVADSTVWVLDPAVTHTADSTGSYRVTADGTMKAAHGVPTAVIAGQQVNVSVFVRWDNYAAVAGSAPIQLHIKQYFKTDDSLVLVGVTTLITFAPTTVSGGWAELAGTYTAPADGSVNLIRGRLVVTQNATAGTIRFDDATARNKLLAQMVGGLPESLQNLLDRIQAFLDTGVNAIFGGTSFGHTLDDWREALLGIPPDHVQGAAGPATMFGSIFGVIDAWLSGAVGTPGATGGSLADVTNVSGQVASNAFLGGEAWRIANILNNTPVARGMLPTGRANYDITSANTFLSVTQSAALSSSFGLLQAMPIGVISWYGYGNSGMTAFYVNIRKVNPATGVREIVHHSANILGDIVSGTTAADADWMFYELPAALAGQPTDSYFVEWVPVGGTHHIRGMSFTDNIKDHPLAVTPCVATVVDYSSNPNSPASSLPKATAGPNVPWVEFAVSLGDVADHREPKLVTLEFDGQTVMSPSWANRIDLIPLSRGGKGHDGAFDLLKGGFLNGQPGEPGNFAPITVARGTHWSTDSVEVTFNIVGDGNARLSIPGYDTTAIAGADGAAAQFGLQPVGRGPGVKDYNGQKYPGGVDQAAWGGAGADPGGGGNGGRGLALQAGGPGGKPVGFVCFRQVEVDGETTGGDTTPPNIDALDVTITDVTAGGFTLAFTGAVDE
ncbi:MAG: hypothetical protein VYA67_21905 [Actinomycetota bacterium]|nr:hypothetical protein [Actinomycetota bacterium]